MGLANDDSILDAVLANLPGIAFRCLNDPAWTMIYISEGLRDMSGYEVADVLGSSRLSYADLIHPDDRPRVWTEIQDALAARRTYQVEYRLVRADGQHAWVWEQGRGSFDEQGELRFLDGVVIDANARVAHETSLRRSREQLQAVFDVVRASEERFRTLVEEAPLAIVVQTEGLYRYANRAARLLYCETPERPLVGCDVMDVTHPDFRDTVSERIKTVRERRSVPSIRFTLLTLAGRPVEAESSAVPVLYEGKNGALVFLTDMTERIRAEEELRMRDEQLQQAQKMEAIGRLAGGVAHDFNNLLTAVLGYSELILAGDLSDPEELRSDVTEIRRAAVRAKELTSQILAFSRRQPRQPKVCRANDLVRESEPLLRRTLGEDVELVYSLAPDAGSIEVDPGQFAQILMNLAVNARDAMSGGGRLAVDTSRIVHEGSDWTRLTIADTGRGMDRDTIARVFEPFFTTKQPGEGTGLGLATVYAIVAQSGGKISVSSEVGSGTVFTVLLANVTDPEDEAAAKQVTPVAGGLTPVSAPGEQRRLTILLVEDEPAVRDLAARVLRQEGFEVLEAADGDQAAGFARDLAVKLDVLLTDVVLPGELQGDEVARLVQAAYPAIKCLFMSGYPRDVIAKAGRVAEGVDYLEKPFSPEGLTRSVRELTASG